jgi:hypothetical protein
VTWKELKQISKNSPLAKICHGRMFHLGITENYDNYIFTLSMATSLLAETLGNF